MVLAIYLCFAVAFATCTGSASAKLCWYPQTYNSHHPGPGTSRSDSEPLPKGADLAKICPQGGQTLAARCRDNKGEPFSGTQNRTCAEGYFVVSCDAVHGMSCTPYAAGCTCPDFSVEYGCECPVTTKGISGGTTQVPGKATGQSTNPASGNGNGKQTGNDGNNGGMATGSVVMHVVLVVATCILTL